MTASDDDAAIRQYRAAVEKALSALDEILATAVPVDQKRAALFDAYEKEMQLIECVGIRGVEAFDENPRSARTRNAADNALNFSTNTINFFEVLRQKEAELRVPQEEKLIPNLGSFSNMQRLVATYHRENVKELKKSFQLLNLPATDFDKPFPMPGDVPKWFPIVGSIFAGLTLLFFMALVVVEIIGQGVPATAKFLVVCVLALGAALGGSFLGGAAAANGSIPLPFAKNRPIAFSVTGGIGILVIVMALGFLFYVQPAQQPSPTTPRKGESAAEFVHQGLGVVLYRAM